MRDSPFPQTSVARAALFFLLAVAMTGPADAAFVERFRDWSLYVHNDPSGRICFVAATPSKQEGNFSRRDQPRLFVTQFGGSRPKQEFSVDPGYTYMKGSMVEVTIDGIRFDLFTDKDRAWARNSEEDARVIAAMRRGSQMTVRGTSVRQTWSLDTYSLLGFTAAHNAMVEACKNASSP